MGCDTVVAVGPATVDGDTLFAHSSHRPTDEYQSLCLVRGREYTSGEKLRAECVELPQARQTYTVLGSRPGRAWGYTHGLNEHGLAVGGTCFCSKLRRTQPGLVVTDLVRLVLERCTCARKAVDLLIDLVEHHGQGTSAGSPEGRDGDASLLVADSTEAFAFEAAGSFWVYQQIEQVRAASDVGIIRQDWNRISHGLADQAIRQGWWPADGSKLDFAAALCANPVGEDSALRRWGRATLLLEQQNGHIDLPFLRRLMSDHYEGMKCEVDPLETGPAPAALCRHPTPGDDRWTAASMVAQLHADASRPRLAWCAFGPPCISVWFPVYLDGLVPEPMAQGLGEGEAAGRVEGLGRRLRQLHDQLRRDPLRWNRARSVFGRLQARVDQEVEQFAPEAAALKSRAALADLQRLAGILLQHHLELLDEALAELAGVPAQPVGAEPTSLGLLGR
jgi:dipeptidase